MPLDLSERSAGLRAGIAAALARPVLLYPGALDSVRAASTFMVRAEAGEGSSRSPAPFTREGDVAVVRVEGPLAQRAWSCMGMFGGDGYDAIEGRVRAALSDPSTKAVVLRLDSPGGEVAGCFEAVRAIRAASAEAGKPLVAYVDEMAASAAYALACACDEIVAPDTGLVGSIGVIMQLPDESAAMAAEGLAVSIITSGAAKADGHPAMPLTTEARARFQAEVDHLAQIFAGEVAAGRPIDAAEALALDARVFHGSLAKAAGLVDAVGPFALAVSTARALADRRSPRTNPGARRGASTPRKPPMNEELLAAIAAVTGETEPTKQAAAVSALHAKLTTTETKLSAAEKAVAGLSQDLSDANARASAATARVEKIEREGVLGEIKAAGKWSASLDGFLATQSVEQLRAYLASAPRVVPGGAIEPPAAPPSSDAQLPTDVAELAAKATRDGWAALTAREKHAVTTHSKSLAARLRDAKR